MQNDENVLRSLNKQRSSHLLINKYNFASCIYDCAAVHRVRDWETVKIVVPGSSSLKPDQLCSERKGAEQSSNAYLF